MHESPDLWLIRTNENLIAGPYPKEQIRKLIADKTLTPQDEICQANRQWVILTHVDEAEKLLDFEFPKDWFKPDSVMSSDVTRTQMDGETEPGTPTPTPVVGTLPDIPDLEEFEGTDTALLTSRAFRTLQIRKQARIEGRPFGAHLEVVGGTRKSALEKLGVERARVLRSIVWLLLAVGAVAVAILIQVMRKP